MNISIIIPVLNEAADIENQLMALSKVIDESCEVIVVDGGSKDETVSLARPLASKVIVADSKGRAVQMNAGAEVASGECLLFLHCDTRLPLEFSRGIEKITEAQWGFFPVLLSGQSSWFRLIETMINCRSSLSQVATGDQALFISRSLFKKIKGFAHIALMEDVEISKRLRKLYSPMIMKHKVVTSSRRWESKGIVKTIVLMWRLRWDYFLGVSPEKLVARYYS